MWLNAGMWIATLCYMYQTTMYAYTSHYSQALMMFGYTVANFGIIWSIK